MCVSGFWLVFSIVACPSMTSCSLLSGDSKRFLRTITKFLNFDMLPLKPCQNKSFKLRAVKFGENLYKIHTDSEKKNQVVGTFRDNGIKVLRYIHLETVSHLVQKFFFAKKLAKQQVFFLRQWNFSTISTRSGTTSS